MRLNLLLDDNYMSKVNNRNTIKRCGKYSNLTIKTPERWQWRPILWMNNVKFSLLQSFLKRFVTWYINFLCKYFSFEHHVKTFSQFSKNLCPSHLNIAPNFFKLNFYNFLCTVTYCQFSGKSGDVALVMSQVRTRYWFKAQTILQFR